MSLLRRLLSIERPAQAGRSVDPPASPSRPKITAEIQAFAKTRKGATLQRQFNPFIPALPPPWVPQGNGLAMDDALAGWAGSLFGNTGIAFGLGLLFPGFPILAELAARIPEYYRVSAVFAEELTRKWGKVVAAGDEDKTERVAEIEAALKHFKVRECFQELALHDGVFGRAHLYIDTGAKSGDRELTTDIGDGLNETSSAKFRKGFLKDLLVVEPMWCYPTIYEAADPLSRRFYNPSQWLAMSSQVHASRLLTFVGRPVSDILKPAFMFAGLSRTQMLRPSVENWTTTRQSVNALIQAFSVFILGTDLGVLLQEGGDSLRKHIELFNDLRSNHGLMITNKETEDLKNIAVPLGTLDELQAQAQEHMASIAGVPHVKLFGISPHGLNASSEGEIRVFYDSIAAFQESFFRPNLERVFRFIQIHLWGGVDEDLSFAFEPLWSLDEAALATVRLNEAQADQINIDTGIISPLEARKKLAADPDTPYAGLDVEDLPDLREEEQEGLEPKGGHAEPMDDDEPPAEDDDAEALRDTADRIDHAVHDPLPGGGEHAINMAMRRGGVGKYLRTAPQAQAHNQTTAQDDDFALDRASVQEIDSDGRLHVRLANISCANISPYLGREIPGWEQLGLYPERVYQLFRDPIELAKAVDGFNRMPILDRHIPAFAENFDDEVQQHTVGSTGESAVFESPYLKNSLVIWSADAIALIESGARCELSAGYRYTPQMIPGEWEGDPFDGTMTELVANHIALVESGRNGPQCGVDVVGDDGLSLDDILAGDSTREEKIAMVRNLFNRPGTAGEKEAARAALIRLGADPESSSQSQSSTRWRVRVANKLSPRQKERNYYNSNFGGNLTESEAREKALRKAAEEWGSATGKTPPEFFVVSIQRG